MKLLGGRATRVLVLLLAFSAVSGVSASAASAELARVTGTETCPRTLAPATPPRCSDLMLDGVGLYQLVQKNIFGYAISPARLEPRTLSIRFPITGGLIDTSTMLGTVRHAGGIKLVKFSDDPAVTEPVKQLDTTNLRIVNGTTLTGNALGLVPAPTADLTITKIRKSLSGNTIYEADAHINAVTAAALNVYFETDAFTPGLKLGHVKSNIVTQPLLGL